MFNNNKEEDKELGLITKKVFAFDTDKIKVGYALKLKDRNNHKNMIALVSSISSESIHLKWLSCEDRDFVGGEFEVSLFRHNFDLLEIFK